MLFLNQISTKLLMKMYVLAQMGAASFCAVVRHKRYSGQLETAPKKQYEYMK